MPSTVTFASFNIKLFAGEDLMRVTEAGDFSDIGLVRRLDSVKI